MSNLAGNEGMAVPILVLRYLGTYSTGYAAVFPSVLSCEQLLDERTWVAGVKEVLVMAQTEGSERNRNIGSESTLGRLVTVSRSI